MGGPPVDGSMAYVLVDRPSRAELARVRAGDPPTDTLRLGAGRAPFEAVRVALGLRGGRGRRSGSTSRLRSMLAEPQGRSVRALPSCSVCAEAFGAPPTGATAIASTSRFLEALTREERSAHQLERLM
jgi:hypothetical protein